MTTYLLPVTCSLNRIPNTQAVLDSMIFGLDTVAATSFLQQEYLFYSADSTTINTKCPSHRVDYRARWGPIQSNRPQTISRLSGLFIYHIKYLLILINLIILDQKVVFVSEFRIEKFWGRENTYPNSPLSLLGSVVSFGLHALYFVTAIVKGLVTDDFRGYKPRNQTISRIKYPLGSAADTTTKYHPSQPSFQF